MRYNDTMNEFLRKNGIDPNHIPEIMNRPIRSLSKESILTNYLYAVSSPVAEEVVSIGNLYGSSVVDLQFQSRCHVRLLEFLECFFDSQGDSYHNRSVGLLDYREEEIVGQLESSFQNDPIHFTEFDQKLYVTINGNHRAFVLLFHYLNNVRKNSGLQESFQVKARVHHVDLELSGMLFMLSMKYGTRLDMHSRTIKKGKLLFALDNQEYELTVEEFKEMVRQEFSRETCTFGELKEFYEVAIQNSKNDPYMKKAMSGLFEGFDRIDLDTLSKILFYTAGFEQELEQVPFQNKTFIEYMEAIKKTLLEGHLQALKTGLEASNQVDRENWELEIVEANIKRTLSELEIEKKQAQFFDYVSTLYTPELELEGDLEEEERKTQYALEQERKKRFSFEKKKRLLQEKLEELRRKLDAVYFEYEGVSHTLREFYAFYREAKRRPKQDFFESQLELEQSLFDVQMKKSRNIHIHDCIFKLASLKLFCNRCGIDFQALIQNEHLTPAIEELKAKRRK